MIHVIFLEQICDCIPSQQPLSELEQFVTVLKPARKEARLPWSTLQPGDNVVISTDDRLALATGAVVRITATSVTVTSDRDLSLATPKVMGVLSIPKTRKTVTSYDYSFQLYLLVLVRL